MQTKTALVVLSFMLLVIAGCAPKPGVEKVPEAAPEEAWSTEQGVAEIGSSVKDIEELETGLDVDELDQLERDLAELDALEIE